MQYDTKRESSSHNSINVTDADAVYNYKRLVVQIWWPTYTNCYEQTKLNYDMYALEF